MTINATKDNFETEVLKYKGKVLVDFWAEWCGPCQMLSPIIDEIEKENPSLKVAKVDTDAEPQLSIDYNVSGIPTVLIFDNGKLVNTIVGFHQKQDYLNAVK